MSIVSRWITGAMASKKARSRSPVMRANGVAQCRRGERAGGDDDAVPFRRRQAGDFAALDGDERMRLRAAAVTSAEKASRSTASAPPAGSLCRSPAARMSEPARRISSCSSPTAFVSQSSERNELEHTSSARPSVLCASVILAGRISCSTTGTPAPAICQAASEPREAAADDVNGLEFLSWRRTLEEIAGPLNAGNLNGRGRWRSRNPDIVLTCHTRISSGPLLSRPGSIACHATPSVSTATSCAGARPAGSTPTAKASIRRDIAGAVAANSSWRLGARHPRRGAHRLRRHELRCRPLERDAAAAPLRDDLRQPVWPPTASPASSSSASIRPSRTRQSSPASRCSAPASC